jgi:enoyl-[acyl-carrier protein] reductase II
VQLIGQVQGLIDDIPGVQQLFERIMQEADDTLTRLQCTASMQQTFCAFSLFRKIH